MKMSKKSDHNKSPNGSSLGIVLAIGLPIVIRWCVAAYPYSGNNKPPMYGDYEAQRHWQEITWNLPVQKWYENSTQNDLNYWGLDYPPLTAYHSFIIAAFANVFLPQSVSLFTSRGFESETHKEFMRLTVFFADLLIYVSAVYCIGSVIERNESSNDKNIFKKLPYFLSMTLLYPGLILIDYGHFQYNCISLGFFLWSYFFLVHNDNILVSAIFFVMALNYKQMELYHALPIFFYMLRKCLEASNKNTFLKSIAKLGFCVIVAFLLIWIPFISNVGTFLNVLQRLFPLNRGVFEDKVSNVWCTINVFIKVKTILNNIEMARVCLIATLLASAPSSINLLLSCSKIKFVLSCLNVSLAFFLFSFHVHEKTILLCAIPALLHFPDDPFMVFWFLLLTNFSMVPLLIKDGLFYAYIGCQIIYITSYSFCFQCAFSVANIFSAHFVNKTLNIKKNEVSCMNFLLSILFCFSCIGIVILSFLPIFLEPPPKLPDLFPLLISIYSCAHFMMFFLYFNYQQFISKDKIRSKND